MATYRSALVLVLGLLSTSVAEVECLSRVTITTKHHRSPVVSSPSPATSSPAISLLLMGPPRPPSAAARSRPLIGAAGGSEVSPLRSWVVRHRSILLLVALVVHKTITDVLTRYTRIQTAYSGATVAVLSEIFKIPLLGLAICGLGGGATRILPTIRGALARPLNNAWIGLCYTFNNLLYFDALSAISAVAYQVLSQSKTIFTAGLMYVIVGKKLILRQVARPSHTHTPLPPPPPRTHPPYPTRTHTRTP